MLKEEEILQLPRTKNYHYSLEHVDSAECMVIYYRLSDNMWNRHVEYCKDNGFENKLNQWLRILVDVEDFKVIESWSVKIDLKHLYHGSNKMPYIRTGIAKIINKKQIFKSIHRYILNPPKTKQVDHINHNTLDNRRCNLRLVTRSENNQNKNGAMSNSKTGIRGVNVRMQNKGTNYEKQYYSANIILNRKKVFEKYFPFTPQGLKDAEQAVIEARLKYFTHSEMDKQAI